MRLSSEPRGVFGDGGAPSPSPDAPVLAGSVRPDAGGAAIAFDDCTDRIGWRSGAPLAPEMDEIMTRILPGKA